ncbi:hypothetical protein D7V83_05775 [bacterium 0.1xD8-71]|nr:hypothetical protein D7V83_05775 [bacterium 0.1xD8-71]
MKERALLTKKVNKATLILRMVVSGYLLYLAYELIRDYGTADNQMLVLGAVILFIVAGGLIFAVSAYQLITKKYDDGSEDDEQPEQTVVDDKEQTTDEDDI